MHRFSLRTLLLIAMYMGVSIGMGLAGRSIIIGLLTAAALAATSGFGLWLLARGTSHDESDLP
jgi:hypothetical protein